MVETEKYAGFWVRVVASFIDSLVMIVPLWIISFVITIVTTGVAFVGSGISEGGSLGLLFGGSILNAVVIFGLQAIYFILQEGSVRQATIGKRLMGIRVYSSRGDRLTYGEATARYFGKILSSILYIGYIMVGVTQRKQGLHDMLIGSTVEKDVCRTNIILENQNGL